MLQHISALQSSEQGRKVLLMLPLGPVILVLEAALSDSVVTNLDQAYENVPGHYQRAEEPFPSVFLVVQSL